MAELIIIGLIIFMGEVISSPRFKDYLKNIEE